MAAVLRSNRLKDVQATCLAYDSKNGNVILPGRRAFMFVSLSDDSSSVRYTLRQAAVADATRIYCNPEQSSVFAIARGQCLELYEFNKVPTQSSTEICSKKMDFQAHTKAVDDIAWCPTVPNWLVSCSRDQYAILWDTSRSEAVTNFRATSPFSCCCWLYPGKTAITNGSSALATTGSPQLSGYVVVTTADSRLLFWDVRAGSRPAIVVQAHALRIHALDAGSASSEQYQLVTAADGDSRIALWDVRNLDRKISSIESPFGNQAPRRIRFSPSGGMLVATASTMPRPASIDEPRAAIISLTDSAVFMLQGHTDAVYDAVWPSGDAVLTWSQDFYLRQFQLAPRTAYGTLDTINSASSFSNASDANAGLSRDSTPSTPPMLRPVDSTQGQSSDAATPGASIPSSAPLLLPLVSPQTVLTPMIPQPPPLPTQAPSATNLTSIGTPAIQFAIAPTDYMIPSPRTAGARFCPAGFLVSLHRLYELKQKPSDRALADFHRAFSTVHSTAGGRPRGHRARHTSLSRPSESSGFVVSVPGGFAHAHTAGVLSGAVSPNAVAVGTSHQQFAPSGLVSSSSGLTTAASSTTTLDNVRQHSVLIYSVNALLKCNRELAIECRLDWTNPAECCRSNVDIALAFDRPDLAQAFSVAALVLDDTSFMTKPDLVGCIGRDALIRMFTHFVKQGCIQDAAMIAFFLSFTGIDLNNTPEDSINEPIGMNAHVNSMSMNANDMPVQGSRTPPESAQTSLVATNISGAYAPENQSSEGYVMYDHSYTVGPSFLQAFRPAIQVSAVKRSSSWHDVQSVSPGDGLLGIDGSASASGEARSRHPSSRQQVSPPKGSYNTRNFTNCRDNRLHSGCTEAERIQMSVVLRCYATQLHAWRLHDRRTALLRPLNAVSAGQLSPIEPSYTIDSIRMIASNSIVPRSSTSAGNAGLYHQSSIDSGPGFLAPATTPTNIVVSAACAVCDRPVRGLSSICVMCGHGGHALHIREFFSSSNRTLSCPAGCGCRCPSLRSPYLDV